MLEARYDPKSHTAAFTDRSYDIGDQPVTGLALNEDNGDLYAATDFGVLVFRAARPSWVRAGTACRASRSTG